MTMRSAARQFGLSCLVVVAAVFSAAGARANPTFPQSLIENVPMPSSCAPLTMCILCHNNNMGGPGNIKLMSMGTTWPMYGLDGNKPETLVPALNNARGAMQDTDHDMVPDVVELSTGHDPNNADPKALVCGAGVDTGPVYGCGRVARRGPIDNVGAAVGALVALIGLAAIRRRAVSKRRAP
jgi:hypothetical protein